MDHTTGTFSEKPIDLSIPHFLPNDFPQPILKLQGPHELPTTHASSNIPTAPDFEYSLTEYMMRMYGDIMNLEDVWDVQATEECARILCFSADPLTHLHYMGQPISPSFDSPASPTNTPIIPTSTPTELSSPSSSFSPFDHTRENPYSPSHAWSPTISPTSSLASNLSSSTLSLSSESSDLSDEDDYHFKPISPATITPPPPIVKPCHVKLYKLPILYHPYINPKSQALSRLRPHNSLGFSEHKILPSKRLRKSC